MIDRRAFAWLLALALLARFETASSQPPSRVGPPTVDTCFWTDREFKDLPERGPDRAAGLVLWSHGQIGNRQPSWHGGAPPVIRLFADKGWDVVLVQRNERCEGDWAHKGRDYVDNLVGEVARARQRGYASILVAGQSYGAGTALGAAGRSDDISGVMAFALSHGRGSCRSPRAFTPSMIPMHAAYIKQAIAEARAPRILISMGKDDHCVGHSFTPLVASGLAAKKAAYIHLDESMAFLGHGAAMTPEFAATYGECIVTFFTQEPAPSPGRHVC